MIDEQWLSSLRFRALKGLEVHGLEGLGSEAVVLEATTPEGRPVVLKIRRHHLGFHIRELPLFLTEEPAYEVGTVNQKLAMLMGEPLLDTMVEDYDRLHGSVIRLLERVGFETLLLGSALRGIAPAGLAAVDNTEALQFFLQTPGIRRRLDDWAELSPESGSIAETILTVNGPNFPFTRLRANLIAWANATREEIDRLEPVLRPSELVDNPLYVWGAAVMDGFFTENELPEVVAFLDDRYGPLRKHKDAFLFYQQIRVIGHLLVNYLKDSHASRLDQLCAMLGFPLDLAAQRLPDMERLEIDPPDDEPAPSGPRRSMRVPRPSRRKRRWTDEEFVFRRMGFAVASMHEVGSLHGDLHFGNLTLEPGTENDPRFVVYDFSRASFVERPPTTIERAQDMIALRAECTDAQWIAFTAGYLERSPAQREAIDLLDGDPVDLADRADGP